MAAPAETIEQVRSTVIDLALRFGPRLLTALIILGVGYLVGRQASRWLERALLHFQMEPPVRSLIVRIARVIISLLFVIMAIQNLGVELLPLIAGLGVAGAGIALAMQGLLSNLFAGLTIIFTRPFRVGEYIGIVGEEGTVETITLFQTTLSHPDRSRVVIPNRKIAGEILHNYGAMRQVTLTVGIPHAADVPTALGTARAVLAANPGVLTDPAPLVGVGEVTDVSIKIRLQPWVRAADAGTVEPRLYEELIEAFRKRGIATPLPRHEVRMIDGAVAR
jgi:small conductance mechanosensitive channel